MLPDLVGAVCDDLIYVGQGVKETSDSFASPGWF